MNVLEQYFADVERAQALAARVGCSHTTLYRIAAGKVRPRNKLALRIERETGGRVTRAAMSDIADQADADAAQASGAPSVARGAGEGAEECGEIEGGAARGAFHSDTVSRDPAADHREPFSPDVAP